MLVAIGSDHAGYELKEKMKAVLADLHLGVVDFGCTGPDSVDYPDFGMKVAEAVNSGRFAEGILICGTGIGMSIVANRFPNIRAALCHNEFTAQAAREHNNANILVMGARVVSEEEAAAIINTWFRAEFLAGRHSRRLAKISQLSQDIREGKYDTAK